MPFKYVSKLGSFWPFASFIRLLKNESLGPVGRSEQDEDSAAVEEKESLTLVDRVLDGESAAAPEQQDSITDESQPKEKEGEGEASGLRQVLSNLLNGG